MSKTYSQYIKLREPNYCYYPLHLDPYGSGCSNDCTYCFQKDQLYFRNEKDEKNKTRKPTAWRPNNPSISPMDKIENIFEEVFEKSNSGDIEKIKKGLKKAKIGEGFNSKNFYKYLIAQKLPLRIGGVTDPFQDAEEEHRVTYNILKMLNKYDYPAQIVTKSDLVLNDDYLELLREGKGHFYFQVTITTMDEKLAELIEPNSPTPKRRREVLSKLNDLGLTTAVRINPLHPQDLYNRIGEDMEEFISKIAETETETVIVGGLRVQSKNREYGPIASAEFMNDALREDDRLSEIDIKNLLEKRGGTYYIPEDELLTQYREIKQYCDEYDLNFTLCHDSNKNARKEEFVKLWHDTEDCCNALNNVEEFNITFGKFRGEE